MKVLLIGIGLIGGSLVKAIRKDRDIYVIGIDENRENEEIALSNGIIDEIGISLIHHGVEADLIILSTPVEGICHYISILKNIPLKENVIITDVGSTKETIMNAAKQLSEKRITFIGGHPMAGSHKTGVLASKESLFENAYYILTPNENCDQKQVEKLKDILAPTNAYILTLDSDSHDKITGMISHFPHLIAAGLVRQAYRFSEYYPLATDMAAGGFRDITRIASSSPAMWRDIVSNNHENLIHFIDEWSDEMQTIKDMIRNRDPQQLFDFFSGAKNYRDSLPIRKSGAIPAFYDLFVDILDSSGAIANVTGIIARAKINIKNLGIIEAREGMLGVFRISFRTEEDRRSVKALLEAEGYDTYIKF